MNQKTNWMVYMTMAAVFLVNAERALSGEKEGNGGEPVAIHFFKTQMKVLEAMEKIKPAKLSGVNLSEVRKSLEKVIIISTDEVLRGPDNKPRPAISNPVKKEIYFNTESWFGRGQNPAEQVELAWHEALVVSDQEGSGNYAKSYATLQNLPQPADKYVANAPFKMNLAGTWNCQGLVETVTLRIESSTSDKKASHAVLQIVGANNSEYVYEGELPFEKGRPFFSESKTASCQGSFIYAPTKLKHMSKEATGGTLQAWVLGWKKLKLTIPRCNVVLEGGTYWISPLINQYGKALLDDPRREKFGVMKARAYFDAGSYDLSCTRN